MHLVQKGVSNHFGIANKDTRRSFDLFHSYSNPKLDEETQMQSEQFLLLPNNYPCFTVFQHLI